MSKVWRPKLTEAEIKEIIKGLEAIDSGLQWRFKWMLEGYYLKKRAHKW